MEITANGIKSIWDIPDKTKSQKHVQLTIPFYQRPFKWEEDDIKDLFNDYFNRGASKKGHYFVGTVIAYDRTDASKPELVTYDVIDGQQRLTTLFLLNYLRFIIERDHLEMCIKNSEDIRYDFGPLIDKYAGFIGNGTINITKMKECFDDISNELKKKAGADYNRILDIYRKALGMTDKAVSDNDYEKDYKVNLKKFIMNEHFVLEYSRESLYNKLVESLYLIRFAISERDLYPGKEDYPNDAVVKKYLETFSYLYKYIKIKVNAEQAKNNKIFNDDEYTIETIKVIDSLLEGLQFCLLTSRDEDDAYTLFEVLNDRGYDVTDLELMKNMILKQYWRYTTDIKKDDLISKLDDLWEETFDPNMGDSARDLVAYLGTIYLTGDKVTTPLNIKTPYRDLVRDKRYKSSSKEYNYTEAYNDVVVFLLVKIILSEAEIKYKSAIKESISAEKRDYSVIYKCINLLHAIKCDGVIPVIVNVLINDYIQTKKLDLTVDEININEFEEYVKCAMGKRTATPTTVKTSSAVNEIADLMWKYALLSEDYNSPRTVTANVLPYCWRDKYDTKKIKSLINPNAVISEFEGWIKSWRYGKNEFLKHRIMIIQLRLLRGYSKTSLPRGAEQLDDTGYTFRFPDDADIHLDHLEPQTPDSSRPGDYYSESDLEERKDKVDALGNMMILDYKNNERKQNVPMDEGINDVYSKIGQYKGHFLLEDIIHLLGVNNTSGETTPIVKVPTSDFFEERSSRMINYFEKMLTSSYKQNPIGL